MIKKYSNGIYFGEFEFVTDDNQLDLAGPDEATIVYHTEDDSYHISTEMFGERILPRSKESLLDKLFEAQELNKDKYFVHTVDWI